MVFAKKKETRKGEREGQREGERKRERERETHTERGIDREVANLKKRCVKTVRTRPIMERTLAAMEKASSAGFLGGVDVLALMS